MGAPDNWADGLRTGAYKNKGTQKHRKRAKNGKTPRVGIRKRRKAGPARCG